MMIQGVETTTAASTAGKERKNQRKKERKKKSLINSHHRGPASRPPTSEQAGGQDGQDGDGVQSSPVYQQRWNPHACFHGPLCYCNFDVDVSS